jgi:hypothetical protein
MYCLDRVPAVVKEKPELANIEPFKTVLSGDREAIANPTSLLRSPPRLRKPLLASVSDATIGSVVLIATDSFRCKLDRIEPFVVSA